MRHTGYQTLLKEFVIERLYEGLLLKMGEKANDGGQFFTPREVIRVMVKAVNPTVGETVYDRCCGTGGFLAQCYEYLRDGLSVGGTTVATAEQMEALKSRAC